MQGLLLVVVPTNCHVHVIYVICIFKHYPEVIGQTMPTEIFPCTRKEVQRYFARVTYFFRGIVEVAENKIQLAYNFGFG